MMPTLVFFVVATAIGCLLLMSVRLRLRAVARRNDASDGELCELRHASRITSIAVAASLTGLALAGLAYLIVSAE